MLSIKDRMQVCIKYLLYTACWCKHLVELSRNAMNVTCTNKQLSFIILHMYDWALYLPLSVLQCSWQNLSSQYLHRRVKSYWESGKNNKKQILVFNPNFIFKHTQKKFYGQPISEISCPKILFSRTSVLNTWYVAIYQI